MFKSIALWLCPDLVSRQLLDDANKLLVQRINECEQLRSQLHSEESDKCRFRDDVNKTSVQLDATFKALEATQVELQATYAAWKVDSEEKGFTNQKLTKFLNDVKTALAFRKVGHRGINEKTPASTLRPIVINQNTILDEIDKTVTQL
jgi:hypothetical protein